MNRIVAFGIAILFAVIGIALMGGDNVADAGQRCGGCGGCAATACDGCAGACGGRMGLFARLRAKDCCQPACCAPQACNACGCNPCACSCGGNLGTDGAPAPTPTVGDPGDAGSEPPPAPDAGTAASLERAPMVYRQVNFRR